jgi:RHS repeat-associated protein
MGTNLHSDGVWVAVRTGTTNSVLRFLLGDHLGSTSLTVTTGGAEYAELRYYAWGGTRFTSGTTPTSFRYTGQREQSEIGLYFYGSRWYDSALGRFTSPDTIIPNPGDPPSYDRYSYVRNNPLKYVDPSGHNLNCGQQGSHASPEDCADVIATTPRASKPGQALFEQSFPTNFDVSALDDQYARGAYTTLAYLASLDGEWWGEELSAQEAIAMVLYLEASVALEEDANGVFVMNSDVREAITRRYNEYCSAGPWSAGCFDGFWGYYEPLVNGSRLDEIQGINLYDFTYDQNYYGNVYMRTAAIVATNFSIGGIDTHPNCPTHWVTLSESSNRITYSLVQSMIDDHTYPFFSFGEGPGELFIVLSTNLAIQICGSTHCTHAP